MSGDEPPRRRNSYSLPRWIIFALILGLYLTLRGYHSLDGDQAYRLPLLLHRQDPRVFSDDPFVRAFETFNPHRGSLLVLDLVTRPLGLSAGLFTIFVLTFGATCLGVHRLSRAVWPEAGRNVGLVAIGMVLIAKAGNVGTNHIFEAMVLDRLTAFALGWLALAHLVADPARGLRWAMVALALATLIHPSVGLQLAIALGGSWAAWSLPGRWMQVNFRTAIMGIVGLGVAVIPGLVVNLAPGSSLLGDMPAHDFWLLTAELQSPQHMLPHSWRTPQWLGWACYLALAGLAIVGSRVRAQTEPIRRPSAARFRLITVLAVILLWLGASWYAIEVLHQIRITVFQPFRMATIARGIALVLVAGRVMFLWRSGGCLGRVRATVLPMAFGGDWLLVVVTLAELAVFAVEVIRVGAERIIQTGDKLGFLRLLAVDNSRTRTCRPLRRGKSLIARLFNWRVVEGSIWFGVLVPGFVFLARHDTEFGNRTLLVSLFAGLITAYFGGDRSQVRRRNSMNWDWNPSRLRVAVGSAWVVPLAALFAAAVLPNHPASGHPIVQSLVNRCRFAATPADDVERLALWCRDHTPADARFIGPPGPKTFRLWSLRSLAFNRAASPYNAAGLADWFARFQEHVDFHGSATEFVRAYLADRHGFEARYQAQTDAQRAALAIRQGASYIVADAPKGGDLSTDNGPLDLLHVEGRYAVYRVKPDRLVQRQR